MNDTDNRFIIGISVLVICFLAGFVAWAVLHHDTCSICGKELNNRKIMLIHASNGVHFNACENCIWEAFKDRLK